MATFRIHEDLEKENRTNKGINIGVGNKNEKRSTNVFGILDNKLSKNVSFLSDNLNIECVLSIIDIFHADF